MTPQGLALFDVLSCAVSRALKALAVAAVLAGLACGAAGCQGARDTVPAIFTPSPAPSCPPGWHAAPDGGCLITGTLPPGQPLPAWPQVTPGATSGVVAQ